LSLISSTYIGAGCGIPLTNPKAFAIVPGSSKLNVVVKDATTGGLAQDSVDFEVK